MAFEPNEFEFWRDLPPKDAPKRRSFEEIYDEQKQPEFVDVPKQPVQRKKTRKRNRSVAYKATIAALLIGLGIGIAKTADFAAPYISAARQHESDRQAIAQIAEDYSHNGGYLLSLNLAYEDVERGFFDETPRDFDYESPENVWVTSSGTKVGPLVDYFDGLDALVSEYNGGKGYYEMIYEMNEIDKMFGREPSHKCVYTQEELARMYGPGSQEKSMEVEHGKGL